MATCNFMRISDTTGLAHDTNMLADYIFVEDSLRPRLGETSSGQVGRWAEQIGTIYPANLINFNELVGGLYFPLGPCVNITGGVSHRFECSSKGTVKIWQSTGEECQNEALIGQQNAVDVFAMSFEFKHGDSVVCAEDQGCGYAYIRAGRGMKMTWKLEGGVLHNSLPTDDVTVWMGTPDICMRVDSGHWEDCVYASPNNQCSLQDGQWRCPKGRNYCGVLCDIHGVCNSWPAFVVSGEDTGLKVTCSAEGKVAGIVEFPWADCSGTGVEVIDTIKLAGMDSVCVRAGDMSTSMTDTTNIDMSTFMTDISTYMNDTSTLMSVMSTFMTEESLAISSAPSVKGWVVTALMTASVVAMFAV